VAAIFYKVKCGFQALIKQALTVGAIVGLLWLTYAVWFLSGADDLGSVADAWDYTPASRLERLLEDIAPAFNMVDWTLILISICSFLYFLASRRTHKSKIDLALKAAFLVVPIALVVAFVTFTAPIPDVRYAFFVLPCLAIIYGVALSRLCQDNVSFIAALTVLALYAFTAVITLENLPAPMSFRSDAQAVAARHALHDIQSWQHENGYQDVTIRTICTNLMIFAQFDIRLPFTGLSFSSQRFAPPERALPEMAARSDLLLTCPRDEIIGDLKIAVPYWVDFYSYLNATPVLSENEPLEEVGRIGEYKIYRVKPEAVSERQLTAK
jgi:hypothetical protein